MHSVSPVLKKKPFSLAEYNKLKKLENAKLMSKKLEQDDSLKRLKEEKSENDKELGRLSAELHRKEVKIRRKRTKVS